MDEDFKTLRRDDQKIDEELGEVHHNVLRLKDAALSIQTELRLHDELLDDLENQVHKTDQTLVSTNTRLTQLVRKELSPGRFCCYIVLGLLVVAIFIGAIIIFTT